jgi:hypothetical protein
MPRTIGRTSDGRDIQQHDPAEGCHWQCTTCGTFLRGHQEVHGHWALASRGHSVFLRLGTEKVYHCTIEGLHERDWDVEELSGLSSSALVHPRSLLSLPPITGPG